MESTNARIEKGWLILVCLLGLIGCDKRPDMNPPPLNPRPKEAVHIHASFDDPENAKRYALTMHALYQNQQGECGYIDYWKGGSFTYPSGTFDIPNESTEEGHADFTIYLDRYDRETCNWELAAPAITMSDALTGRKAYSTFGSDKDLSPGAVFKETCQFRPSEFPQSCYSKQPVPDLPHYARVSLTIRVAETSAPLHPRVPGYFGHFIKPMEAR